MGSKLQLAIEAPNYFRISQIKQDGRNRNKLKKGARIIGATTIIGEFIKVTILQIESGLLRFAIDEPKEISIFREELYQEKYFPRNQNVQGL